MNYRLWYNRRFHQQLDALPGDVRAMAKQATTGLTRDLHPTGAQELDNHPGFWRLGLPRNLRLVWRVLEGEQIINLLSVGPKVPDLYEQLGLGKRLRETEDALTYQIELDREEAMHSEEIQDSARSSAVN